MSKRIYFAGGGTAGHLMPAIAVADRLVGNGVSRDELLFIGASRGVESRVVPDNGYQVAAYPGRGLKRKLTPAAIVWNGIAVCELVVSTFLVFSLLVRKRPGKVVVVGGYGAAPSAIGAFVLRIPIYVIHVDATPGLVNRVASRFAKAAFVPSEEIDVANKVVTGVPVRAAIENVKRDAPSRKSARKKLGVSEDSKMVLVLGGSLGSRTINKAIDDLQKNWAGRSDVFIRHVIGLRSANSDSTADRTGSNYQAVDFDNDVAVSYSAADVLVARSGAITAAEVATVGIPTVFVPLPSSPGDHQRLNAQHLADLGGAVVLEDSECNGASLEKVLDDLLASTSELKKMEKALAESRQIGAAEKIAEVLSE